MKVSRRIVTIEAESRDERRILTDAIEMIHDLGDPDLAEVVRELESQKDALTRAVGTGVINVSPQTVAQLVVGVAMMLEWASDPPDGARDDRADLPLLRQMLAALQAA